MENLTRIIQDDMAGRDRVIRDFMENEVDGFSKPFALLAHCVHSADGDQQYQVRIGLPGRTLVCRNPIFVSGEKIVIYDAPVTWRVAS